MKKVAIIANPYSGLKQALPSILMTARSELWGRSVETYFPQSGYEMTSMIKRIEKEEALSKSNAYEGIVLVGGDGTIHQALRSYDSGFPNRVPLYCFPGGTANDLSRELGLRKDWTQVQRLLDKDCVDLIDLIEVNGVAFATVAGIGIGASLTRRLNENRTSTKEFSFQRTFQNFLRARFKDQFYTFLSIQTILFEPQLIHRVQIKSSVFSETLETSAVFICNQKTLGSKIQVAPSADNNDSRFNVLVVNTKSRIGLFMALAKFMQGSISKDFAVFSSDAVIISSLEGRSLAVFGDGEIITQDTTLCFKVLPKALRVYNEGKAS